MPGLVLQLTLVRARIRVQAVSFWSACSSPSRYATAHIHILIMCLLCFSFVCVFTQCVCNVDINGVVLCISCHFLFCKLSSVSLRMIHGAVSTLLIPPAANSPGCASATLSLSLSSEQGSQALQDWPLLSSSLPEGSLCSGNADFLALPRMCTSTSHSCAFALQGRWSIPDHLVPSPRFTDEESKLREKWLLKAVQPAPRS